MNNQTRWTTEYVFMQRYIKRPYGKHTVTKHRQPTHTVIRGVLSISIGGKVVRINLE